MGPDWVRWGNMEKGELLGDSGAGKSPHGVILGGVWNRKRAPQWEGKLMAIVSELGQFKS